MGDGTGTTGKTFCLAAYGCPPRLISWESPSRSVCWSNCCTPVRGPGCNSLHLPPSDSVTETVNHLLGNSPRESDIMGIATEITQLPSVGDDNRGPRAPCDSFGLRSPLQVPRSIRPQGVPDMFAGFQTGLGYRHGENGATSALPQRGIIN